MLYDDDCNGKKKIEGIYVKMNVLGERSSAQHYLSPQSFCNIIRHSMRAAIAAEGKV